MTDCVMDGCTTASRNRGLCEMHDARRRRHGDPAWTPPTEAERFWLKVDKTGPCWIWTGALIGGYGTFRLPSGNTYAHRWAWAQAHGPIPPGLTIDHVRENGCASKACVRVDNHLEAVTCGENTRRGDSPSGIAQRLDMCRRGHSYWYVYPDGRRSCIPCRRAYGKARYASRKL